MFTIYTLCIATVIAVCIYALPDDPPVFTRLPIILCIHNSEMVYKMIQIKPTNRSLWHYDTLPV